MSQYIGRTLGSLRTQASELNFCLFLKERERERERFASVPEELRFERFASVPEELRQISRWFLLSGFLFRAGVL